MNNKKRLGLSLSVLLVILLGVFFVLPQLIFSDGQKIKVTVEKPPELDKYITKHEPPKQEIKQVFEYKCRHLKGVHSFSKISTSH